LSGKLIIKTIFAPKSLLGAELLFLLLGLCGSKPVHELARSPSHTKHDDWHSRGVKQSNKYGLLGQFVPAGRETNQFILDPEGEIGEGRKTRGDSMFSTKPSSVQKRGSVVEPCLVTFRVNKIIIGGGSGNTTLGFVAIILNTVTGLDHALNVLDICGVVVLVVIDSENDGVHNLLESIRATIIRCGLRTNSKLVLEKSPGMVRVVAMLFSVGFDHRNVDSALTVELNGKLVVKYNLVREVKSPSECIGLSNHGKTIVDVVEICCAQHKFGVKEVLAFVEEVGKVERESPAADHTDDINKIVVLSGTGNGLAKIVNGHTKLLSISIPVFTDPFREQFTVKDPAKLFSPLARHTSSTNVIDNNLGEVCLTNTRVTGKNKASRGSPTTLGHVNGSRTVGAKLIEL